MKKNKKREDLKKKKNQKKRVQPRVWSGYQGLCEVEKMGVCESEKNEKPKLFL